MLLSNLCLEMPSMIHKLFLGHFDVEEALKHRRLVVLRPLNKSIVTRLLQELGQVDESGRATLGGHTVEIEDGYLVCPWLLARRVEAAEEFARRLHQETGCVMFDTCRREIVRLDQMANW